MEDEVKFHSMPPTFRLFLAVSYFNRRINTSHPLILDCRKSQLFNPNRFLRKFHSAPATMAPKELNFITGNKNKLAEVQAILSATPVKLQSQALDLLEIQGTIEEVSTDKCRRAAEAVWISVKRARQKILTIG